MFKEKKEVVRAKLDLLKDSMFNSWSDVEMKDLLDKHLGKTKAGLKCPEIVDLIKRMERYELIECCDEVNAELHLNLSVKSNRLSTIDNNSSDE